MSQGKHVEGKTVSAPEGRMIFEYLFDAVRKVRRDGIIMALRSWTPEEQVAVVEEYDRLRAELARLRASDDERFCDSYERVACKLRELQQERDLARSQLAGLVGKLPRCQTFGGEGPNGWGEQCKNTALWQCPTGNLDRLDILLKCDQHKCDASPDAASIGMEVTETDWAPLVRALAAGGNRGEGNE